MSPLLRLMAPLALVLLISGCNAGRVMIASPGDYADYRRVRLADTYDDRMAAAWEYLQRRPDGRYHERLQRYFARAEPVYFRARRRNVAGLQAYLRALPEGPHAKEALDLLGVRQYEKRRQSIDARAARITQLLLDARKTNRKSAASLLRWWILALSQPEIWQRPWSELPREVLIRYRLSHPAPECVSDDLTQLCKKPMVRKFAVSSDEGRVERALNVELWLMLDERYHPLSVTLGGASMFMRSHEARDNQALSDDRAARKRVAEAFSRELIEALFAAERVCNGGTEPSGITTLDCDSVRITIEPDLDGGEDRVTFTALAADGTTAEPDAPAEPDAAGEPDPSAKPATPAPKQPAPKQPTAPKTPDDDELYED